MYNSTELYQKYSQALRGLSLPQVYLDMDFFDKNIEDILQRAGSEKTIRLATKSLRCPALMRYILEKSPRFQGLMCYHPREAVWLSREKGFDDLLVAYPSVHSPDIEEVAKELAKGKRIILMVDRVEHLDCLQKVAQKTGQKFLICIDIDLSMPLLAGKIHFGVRRSHIQSMQDLKAWVQIYEKYQASLELVGLMGYEAQIAGLGEKTPGKALLNKLIPWLKKRSIQKLRSFRQEAVEYLRQELGIALPLVNAGGTGSLESSREEALVTELTVGSGFYSPLLFDYYQEFQHLPAMGFALQIVRKPSSGIYTCAGGGYVASGALGIEKIPQPYLPEGLKLDPNELAGEVQSPLYYRGSLPLKIGDMVFFRHAKAGELLEHALEIQALRQDKIINSFASYRGLGQLFL